MLLTNGLNYYLLCWTWTMVNN